MLSFFNLFVIGLLNQILYNELERSKKMKKNLCLILTIIGILFLGGLISYFIFNKENSLIKLPAPEVAEGLRGKFGIDKNINEDTIDNYLNRSDSVYLDVRMLKDPGNYEAIGGDSYLSGFVSGFEVVPYPYLVNVTGLPDAVGKSYEGKTLFTYKDDKYTPNYEESLGILESLFPKDKNIFLMCGGGGYAGSMKNMLIALGWNPKKIYNVGGYWYYKGSNNVQVKEEKNNKISYAFWKVSYHNIDFSSLTEVSK